jgi:hypothetical protein
MVEWAALDVVTADLSRELSAKATYTVIANKNTAQGLYVGHTNNTRLLLGDELQGNIEDATYFQYGENVVQ